jgi:general secretion pathway protein A
MYLSFHNLAEKPFQISTDPRFLWLGEKHQEALANLRNGLLARNGYVVLTGDVGTGKTT